MVSNSNPDAEHPTSQALAFSTLGVNPPEDLGTWFDRLFLCKHSVNINNLYCVLVLVFIFKIY